MTKDPIIEEIHKFREAHARKFNYDMDAIFADLKRKQAKRGNVADLKPVKPVLPRVVEPGPAYRTTRAKKS
jgi:hypothetical protein